MTDYLTLAKECGAVVTAYSTFQNVEFTSATISAFVSRIRADQMEKDARIVRAEAVHEIADDNNPYNLALDHAAAAILDQPKEG